MDEPGAKRRRGSGPASEGRSSSEGASGRSIGSSPRVRDELDVDGIQEDDELVVEAGPSASRAGVVYSTAGGSGASQIADKSCTRCRERKVRCDRVFPECKRCKKRRDVCHYPDIVNVESASEEPEDQRLRLLEEKLAFLEEQLANSNVAHSDKNSESGKPSSSQKQIAAAFPDIREGEDPSAAIYESITREAGEEVRGGLMNFLMNEAATRQNIGAHSSDWSLALPTMAKELTVHLVQASMAACCSRLPAFSLLKKRVQPKYLLGIQSALDPSHQVAITVLCALGARSSPHSAILGIPVPVIPPLESYHANSQPIAMLMSAGERRENAVRALEELAWEMCWKLGVYRNKEMRLEDNAALPVSDDEDIKALEALVGLGQVMIFEDTRPTKARWLLKNALGMYEDLIHSDGDNPAIQKVRRDIGPILYASDATVAAQLNKPCGIQQTQLIEFFDPKGRGPHLLDLSNAPASLQELLEYTEHEGQNLTETQIIDALELAMGWVCACQRVFASLSTVRKPNFSSPLPALRDLWKTVDLVHSSVQRLQQIFIGIAKAPAGLDEYAMDDFVLLGIRTDTALVDLCNMMHGYLVTESNPETRRRLGLTREEETFLAEMLVESELRVRKCLKLLAFYSHLYCSSRDSHMVLHLSDQLNLLPNWIELALQRVGTPGGPTSAEYEVSLEELGWYAVALELACFFTPRALDRLKELQIGREKITPRDHPYSPSVNRAGMEQSPFYSSDSSRSASASNSASSSDRSLPPRAQSKSHAQGGLQQPSSTSSFTQNGAVVEAGSGPYEFNFLPGFFSDHEFNTLGVPLHRHSGGSSGAGGSNAIDPAGHGHGVPLSQMPEFTDSFQGKSWMDLTLARAWDGSSELEAGDEVGGLGRDIQRDLYMNNPDSNTGGEDGSQW